MYETKGCPRCKNGDLFHGKDEGGTFVECIQCGYVRYESQFVTQEEAEQELVGATRETRRGRR